jgi:hypothetical protein
MKNIQDLLKAECTWFKAATEEDFDKDDCGAVQFNRITNSYEMICNSDEAEAEAYISDTYLTEFVRDNSDFQMHDKVSATEEYGKEFCYENDADFDEEKVEEACNCRLIYQNIPNAAEGSYQVIFKND